MTQTVFSSQEETVEVLEEQVDINSNNHLVLFDDDEHTFDFVIDALIKYCGHSSYQAEQCTWIVHHKGKCSVKEGDLSKLKPIRNNLGDLGLTVEIQ